MVEKNPNQTTKPKQKNPNSYFLYTRGRGITETFFWTSQNMINFQFFKSTLPFCICYTRMTILCSVNDCQKFYRLCSMNDWQVLPYAWLLSTSRTCRLLSVLHCVHLAGKSQLNALASVQNLRIYQHIWVLQPALGSIRNLYTVNAWKLQAVQTSFLEVLAFSTADTSALLSDHICWNLSLSLNRLSTNCEVDA